MLYSVLCNTLSNTTQRITVHAVVVQIVAYYSDIRKMILCSMVNCTTKLSILKGGYFYGKLCVNDLKFNEWLIHAIYRKMPAKCLHANMLLVLSQAYVCPQQSLNLNYSKSCKRLSTRASALWFSICKNITKRSTGSTCKRFCDSWSTWFKSGIEIILHL